MVGHDGNFCIKSVKHENVADHILPTKDFDFGEALSQIYPLLDLIFEYLPLNDLNACLDVSLSWKDKAEDALKIRIAPSWFTCYRKNLKSTKSMVVSHSSNLGYSNVELGIILYDHHRMKLNKYVCLHNNIVELSRMSVPEYLEKELVPKSVNYCMLSVHRVVSHFDTERTDLQVQYQGATFDGVFIPKIPSVRTIMFHCNLSKKKEMEDCINTYIKPGEQAKCILLFSRSQLHKSLYNFLQYLVPKGQHNEVALGGGVIKGSKSFQEPCKVKRIFTVKDTVCIVFLKDLNSERDNFEAYSYVISGTGLSKEEFDSELLNFKKHITLKHHRLGFRFCCSAKYQETEIESFTAVFPGVPILGMNVYGEIGWNCYPNCKQHIPDVMPNAKRMKNTLDYPNAENYFSTVFVLLTWD